DDLRHMRRTTGSGRDLAGSGGRPRAAALPRGSPAGEAASTASADNTQACGRPAWRDPGPFTRIEEPAMSSVSVVIPCYNYGHFLQDAVTSVLDEQEGVDVRVLIIDDASHDDSAAVAAKIAANDSRVEVAVHAANKGNIATYNEGLLEWADGDY